MRDLFRRRRSIVPFPVLFDAVYMLNQSLCLFQIRSQPKEVILVSPPHIQGLAASFAHDLMALLQEWKVSSVILFSCADSTFYDISEVRET